MPGLVGLITKKPRAQAEAELRQMLSAMHHEPFYVRGTWSDESAGVYVGWTAIQGSFADGMPLTSEQGDITLVFSGEEYPDKDVRHRLERNGNSRKSAPTYLLSLYRDQPDFPRNLNGLFHGVLVDRTRGTAFLFNDRYGMHRLYVHQASDAFYFAGEAKAILAVRPELRNADPQGLGEFAAYNCVLENRTIFKDIHVLPGGSTWFIRAGGIAEKKTYFDPKEWESQSPLGSEAYYSQLRDALARNLPRYFEGNERVGMTLTGGLDTRVIMAWRNPAPRTLPCYTFGSDYRDCQDVRIGRKVAKLSGQPYEVISVGGDFLSRFAHYAERTVSLTEGGVNLYFTPDLYASERARQIAPAKVVGTYGSEIIRQAVMFKPMMPSHPIFSSEFLTHVKQAQETYRRVRLDHPVTFAAFRQSPWYHHGVLALEQSQLTVRSPYLDNDFLRAVYRAPSLHAGGEDVRLRLIKDGSRELARFRSDRGVGGNGSALGRAISRNYLEFTFKAEYAYDYGMPQWVARVDNFLSPLRLERLFLGRHKFIHFRVWYRDALAEYVRQMLLDSRTLSRPYLEKQEVENIVEGHLKGGRNYTTEIHKLLTMELLQRQFFDAG